MLHLEKTPTKAARFDRSATLPNSARQLVINGSTMSPEKPDIVLLQEQYHLAYEGRKSLQRKCNALEENLEQLKCDRDQLQLKIDHSNAELAKLRTVATNTVPKQDFETLQQQAVTLSQQLEEMKSKERKLVKDLEEKQTEARQLRNEVCELQEENDQLKVDSTEAEMKKAAIEATILELDKQSSEQHKELEYLRTQLSKCEEESSGLRSIVSQLTDSRNSQNSQRIIMDRFNSSTMSLVSNLSHLSTTSISTLTSTPNNLPFNRRSLSAAPSNTKRVNNPVSRTHSITTPSSIGESMAIVRTRDLEMQLEEGQNELQLLKDQLDQADSEKEKLKEQAALDKERIAQLERELKEAQSQVIFVLHKAAAEDLNNNEEQTEEPVDEQQTEMNQNQPADQVSEKLDTLNEKPSSKKPKKKKSRKWYRIFTICIIPAKKG